MTISETTSYIILYSILFLFTCLSIISTFPKCCIFLKSLPKWCQSVCFLERTSIESSNSITKRKTNDFFLSARNSASSWTISLSFVASGMGAWIIYGPPEIGANPKLSWLGILAYAFASALPGILIGILGPHVKKLTDSHTLTSSAFSLLDFCKVRYGRLVQYYVASISCFYMFIYLMLEMTSISQIFAYFVVPEKYSKYTRTIAVSMGIGTILYTAIGGLPASILTDKLQSYIIMGLIVILVIASSTYPQNQLSLSQFQNSSHLTTDGVMAFVTLSISITAAELFNQSTWQRVWASKTDKDIKNGFFIGSFLIFWIIIFFGVMGLLAYAKDSASFDEGENNTFMSFLLFLQPLSNFFHILVLVLVSSLAASSIDSLQNALFCLLSSDILKLTSAYPILQKYSHFFTRVLVLFINIPAIILSAKEYSMLELFLVANLVCATSVVPVFLGLASDSNKYLPISTEFGTLCGCLGGVITVIINGYILQVNNGHHPFYYFWLKNNNDVCTLCGSKTMVTFIIVPLSSFVVTCGMSWLDIRIRREAARRPLVTLPFDRNLKEESEQVIDIDEENNRNILCSKEYNNDTIDRSVIQEEEEQI